MAQSESELQGASDYRPSDTVFPHEARHPLPQHSPFVTHMPFRDLTGRVQRETEFILPAAHIGGFADIYIGHFTEDDKSRTKVAIKVLRMTKEREVVERLSRSLVRETAVWQHLQHPNILKFLGLARDSGKFCCPALISPYCDNGTANDYLKSHPDVNTRLFLIRGITNGLNYLHGMQVVHGDLKPSNILIHDDGRPLLCDFGQSRVLFHRGFTTKQAGTTRYQAPELFMGENIDKAADVYSFSMTSYEIWTGRLPFSEIHLDVVIALNIIQNDTRPAKPDPASRETELIWTILQACWRRIPMDRVSIGEVMRNLDHIFFS